MVALAMGEVSVVEQHEPVHSESPAVHVPPSCRQFVEKLLADALLAAAAQWPGRAIPDVDWDSIWAAGSKADSVEQASGRIVAAAFAAANEVSRALSSNNESYDARYLWSGARTAAVLPQPPSLTVSQSGVRNEASMIASTVPAPSVQTLSDWEPSVAPVDGLTSALPAHSGWSTFFTWVRNIGVVVILFVAWQLWGTSISQHHAQGQLRSTFQASVHAHHEVHASTSSGPALIAGSTVVPVPAEGTPVAQLQIPAIALNEYVVSGTAESDLAKGPGHYVGTAAPGQAGNVAIAGHRTTNGAPFNRLGQLAIGDQISLSTTSGERLTYVVSQSPQAVSPSDVAVLDNFGDNRITLTTCNPEYSSSQRLIVVGELKQPKPPVATKEKPKAYHIANAQTASWDWSLLPIVVIEGGVLLLLAMSNRRFTEWFGGIGRWVILVPLWGAGLYLVFSTLTSFLPATI